MGMVAKWIVPILLFAFASTAEAGVILQSHSLDFGKPTQAGVLLISLDEQETDCAQEPGASQSSGDSSWGVEGHPGFSVGPFAALLETALFGMPPTADRLSFPDGRRPSSPELDGLIKPPQPWSCSIMSRISVCVC